MPTQKVGASSLSQECTAASIMTWPAERPSMLVTKRNCLKDITSPSTANFKAMGASTTNRMISSRNRKAKTSWVLPQQSLLSQMAGRK